MAIFAISMPLRCRWSRCEPLSADLSKRLPRFRHTEPPRVFAPHLGAVDGFLDLSPPQ
jgi:hypothetical protein